MLIPAYRRYIILLDFVILTATTSSLLLSPIPQCWRSCMHSWRKFYIITLLIIISKRNNFIFNWGKYFQKVGQCSKWAAPSVHLNLNVSYFFRCLLQETTVTSLYRRRVARNSFRSAEELRPRPYPAARCPRSPLSPRSPRANSLPRVKPMSPLKFPNGTNPNNTKINNLI